MSKTLFLVVLSGLFFGVWPVMMRASGLGAVWILLFLFLGSGIVGTLAVLKAGLPSLAPIAVLIGLAAGIINGVGALTYGKLIEMQSAEMTKFIPLSVVLIMGVGVVGAYFFLGEELFTMRKIFGIIAAIVAVILLA